ncbi:MAG: hypothetical protein NC299_13350 [Lachnospiraceae bacterium]|nr:hypothetical protein [Ruminococcus sp.]MCM1276322.1 hypothetical protein [Lachnospiraceae bacterium]
MGKPKNKTTAHDLAVKLRKLSDEQLVERLVQKRAAEDIKPRNDVEKFLRELAAEKPRGVGAATLGKIGKFAKEKGYI